MKRARRIVSMMLTLAMLLTMGGFAEEEVVVAEVPQVEAVEESAPPASEPEPEMEAEPEPEPELEPAPAPEPDAQPAPEAEPEAAPEDAPVEGIAASETDHPVVMEECVEHDKQQVNWSNGPSGFEMIPGDAENHISYLILRVEWRCRKCGATGVDETRDESLMQHYVYDPMAPTPHLWSYDKCNVCSLCGYKGVKPCGHSHWSPVEYVSDEGMEPEYEKIDAAQHWKTTTYTKKIVKCRLCGEIVKTTPFDPLKEETLREYHSFDASGVCTGCGYERTAVEDCVHANVVEENILDEDNKYYMLSTNVGHNVVYVCTRKKRICRDCGERIADAPVNPPEKEYIFEEHEFDESGVCTKCKYEIWDEDPCEHTFDDVYEQDLYDEGSVTYEQYSSKLHVKRGLCSLRYARCRSCGEILYGIPVNPPQEIAEYESHEKVNGVCTLCGYEDIDPETCPHTEKDLEPDFDEGIQYEQIPGNEKYHTGIKTYSSATWTCRRCGATGTVDYDAPQTEKEELEHQYASGVCQQCGYRSADPEACSHIDSKTVVYNYDSTVKYEQIPGDEKRHNAIKTSRSGKWTCQLCGATGVENYDPPLEKAAPEAHEYLKGVCELCGYQSADGKACSHPNMKYYNQYGDPYYEQIEGDDQYHTECKVATHQLEQCPDCGYENLVDIKPYTWKYESKHEFDHGFCTECGYKGPACAEGQHRAKCTEPNICYVCGQPCAIPEADLDHGFEIVYDRDYHWAQCPDCKYVWSPKKFPHEYVDGACFCGALEPPEIPPTKIVLSATKLTVGAGGGTAQLSVAKFDPEGSGASVTYTSNKEKVATVDESGLVTGVAKGTATITVKTDNGVSAKCTVTVKGAPSSIKLDKSEIKLSVKQTEQLKATLSSGSAATLTWTSDRPEIASVDESGLVTGVSMGTATITVTSHNYNPEKPNEKLTKSCAVTVLPEPDYLELGCESLTLGKSETRTLEPVVKSVSGDTQATFTYESDDESIATVSGAGKITASKKNVGTAKITVRAHNGLEAALNVTVTNAPTKVAILNNPKTLGVGEKWTIGAQVSAVVNKQNVDCAGAVTFKSSKSSVLAVDKDTGALTAKKAGSAKITATTFNKKSASVTISVKAEPTAIKLDKSEVTMGVGEPNIKLAASFGKSNQYGHVTWASEDGDIVEVQDGVLTAKTEGSATVTASVYKRDSDEVYTAECEVTVAAAPTPETMKLKLPKRTLGVGETMTAEFAYVEGAAGAFSFGTDPEKKAAATVNAKTGVVKGAKAGTVKIVAKAYNGAVASEEIEVVAAPTKVALLNKVTKMGVGETWQLGAQVMSGKLDTTEKVAYSFKSSKPSVVEVDPATGALKALKTGSAKITVTTYNKKSASVTVTVSAAPEEIALDLNEVTLGAGETATLKATLSPAKSYGNVTWTSTDEDVVAVAAGKLTAGEKLGTATVKVSVYNSVNPEEPLTAECMVTVKAAPNQENTDLVPKKMKIGVGESVATELVYKGSSGAVTGYKSNSTKNATVSKAGVIKGVKAGKATITAVTYNDKLLSKEQKVQVEIEVVSAPTKLTFTNAPEGSELHVGETWKPEFNIEGYGGDDLTGVANTFISSNKKYAEFENGVLTAKAPGKVKITCKTYNGKSVSITLTVKA